MAAVTRFAELFAGGDHAHVIANPTNQVRDDGKAVASYVTVHKSAGIREFQMHLADGDPRWLVIIPIRRGDSCCLFGAGDIDQYQINHAALARKVAELGLPLIPDRSKSGGTHLWLFLREWVPAARVRALLKRWMAALGHPGVEIFPKQDTLDASHDGNGIALPYRKGTFAYGPHGNVLSLEAFSERAERLRVTIEEAEAMDVGVPAAAPSVATGRAAPIAAKLTAGQRYPALFSLAGSMHARGMSADAIFAALMTENAAKCDPPHDEETIRKIVAGIGKYPAGKDAAPTTEAPATEEEMWQEQDRVAALLNAKHFVSVEAGQTRVFNEEDDGGRRVLTRSSFNDFRNKLLNKVVPVGFTAAGEDGGPPKIKWESWGKWWLHNHRRREYDRIAFVPLPRGKTCPPETYNLWQGFAVAPKAGDWSLMKKHMMQVVCSGNQTWFDYLIRWMAQGVQRPDQHGWSAVVMRGGEGVGKGIVCEEYGGLFGQHFLHISHSQHLVGHFNLHLRDCVVLFADEAFWAGDKQGDGTLKMLVTGKRIPIEGKGRDVVMGDNHIHLMIASNAAWVIPAGKDARRYFVLDVPDNKKDDRAYFRSIVDQMNGGGRAAMLHDLRQIDLSGFEVRDIPNTSALTKQKELSLPMNERWWRSVLTRGTLADFHDEWMESGVRKSVIYGDYQKAMQATRTDRGRSLETELGGFLKKMLESLAGDWPRSKKVPTVEYDEKGAEVNTRRPGWQFPSLAECRRAFAAAMKAKPEDLGWEEEDDPFES